MDVTSEGGSKTSGGQFEGRKINDVVLPNGDHPLFINRAHFIDYASRMNINFEQLPGLPFWSGLTGYSESWYKSVIGADLVRISAAAGRALKQEEAQRIAHHSAKKCYITSFYTPSYVAIASVLWIRGYDKYRFPFYTPKPATLARLSAFLPSQVAPMLWHSMRFVVYNWMAKFGMGLIFASYPGMVFAVGMAQDKTLDEMAREIAQRARIQMRGQRPGAPGSRSQIPAPPQSQVGDDNSPTAGNGEQWGQDAPPYREDQQQPETQQQKPQPAQSQPSWLPQQRAPRPAAPPPAQSQASEPSSAFDDVDDGGLFDDDASPVAPSGRRGQEQSSETPARSTGSSWSRIREQAKAAGGARGQQQQTGGDGSASSPSPSRGGASGWDAIRQQGQQAESYSNSQQDSSDRMTREQAQREFDAMLERERSGK